MSGGIIPCPAAVVVLLSALSVHRIGLGFLLITAFSVGLAAVLITIGLLVLYGRNLIARFKGDGPLLSRWLPMASAAVITIFGVAITGATGDRPARSGDASTPPPPPPARPK